MLNWDMLKPPGQPLAAHGWGRLARQKQKKELNRAGHEPAFHLRECDQAFGSISACFFWVFRYRGLVKKGRGTLRCCSQTCEARLRAYSCVVTCLLEHGEMPQRVAGL
ncbi:hypothetical protein BOH71_07020 [Bacillus subtilis]|nr:hypothetical protein BOH71_07020 [Bacillus subtilis]